MTPARDIFINGEIFSRTKDELIELKEQCSEMIAEIRLENLVNDVKRFGQAKTLTEFFRGGK